MIYMMMRLVPMRMTRRAFRRRILLIDIDDAHQRTPPKADA